MYIFKSRFILLGLFILTACSSKKKVDTNSPPPQIVKVDTLHIDIPKVDSTRKAIPKVDSVLIEITKADSTKSVSAEAKEAIKTYEVKEMYKVEKIKKIINANKPKEAVKANKGYHTIQILYGTDRRQVQPDNKTIAYADEYKKTTESYHIGYTEISIPFSHVPGETEEPLIGRFDPDKHFVQQSIVPLSSNEFNNLLADVSSGKDGFVFVHGYNNSFRDAAFRTAQLAEDIQLPIVPIMFSWSSNASMFEYLDDEKKVELAISSFKDFLLRVVQNGKFKKIHLVAHSMGNRLMCKVLKELQLTIPAIKFDQLIMASPDMDADDFKNNYAAVISKSVKRITVYSSLKDWALLASKKLHKQVRLGEVALPPFRIEGTDLIDAALVKTDFLGHGAWSQSESIVHDISSLFSNGQSPAERLLPFHTDKGINFYYFKKWAHQ